MPKYDIEVKLLGQDSNVFGLIGLVARELRRRVSDEAATEFADAAMSCGSYDEVLVFIQETVEVV